MKISRFSTSLSKFGIQMKEAIKHPIVSFAKYEIFIIVGVLMSIGVVMKLVFHYNIDSDWFWLLAGLGLMVEGSISLVKRRKFDRKYKIIEINEVERDKK
jgi:hypothetical protein